MSVSETEAALRGARAALDEAWANYEQAICSIPAGSITLGDVSMTLELATLWKPVAHITLTRTQFRHYHYGSMGPHGDGWLVDTLNVRVVMKNGDSFSVQRELEEFGPWYRTDAKATGLDTRSQFVRMIPVTAAPTTKTIEALWEDALRCQEVKGCESARIGLAVIAVVYYAYMSTGRLPTNLCELF